ncbi:MAG: ATP phosphoribosyltransferase [Patescibacteria group bacterium]|nr:ATP phosphoribosyltransferase [Patescibacteria group bacterium]MDD5164718.1 ATP phosphoribosyltransferase [Patescibacteria group bacterium]MDD5534194.1 ATP phosphoribosyltransferase [Patescibacteria group bacterium]
MEKKKINNIMRLALPKGILLSNVLSLLEKIDIKFKFKNNRDYNPICNDLNIKAKLVKVRAIPQLLALGQFNAGFVGLDLIKESGYSEIEPIFDLKLNQVRLVAAVHKSQKDIIVNPPKRPLLIATEYENIAGNWAFDKNLAHIIIQTWGSTEAYAPDDADIVFDNIDTGETMAANNLIVVDEIMRSSTYLVINKENYKNGFIKEKINEMIIKLNDIKKNEK